MVDKEDVTFGQVFGEWVAERKAEMLKGRDGVGGVDWGVDFDWVSEGTLE